jgi:hypothetical protein
MLQRMPSIYFQPLPQEHYPCSPCFPLGTSSSTVPFPSCPCCLSNSSNGGNFFNERSALRHKLTTSLPPSRFSSPPLSSSKSLSSMASSGDAALRRIVLNNSGNSGVFLINFATLGSKRLVFVHEREGNHLIRVVELVSTLLCVDQSHLY